MNFFLNIYNTCTQYIDFDGQELAKTMTIMILILGYTISYLCGIFFNDLKYTLIGGIVTVIITAIIVLPPWPMYRRNKKGFQKKNKSD